MIKYILIFLIISNSLLAQNEVKFSSEGFIFKNPTKEDVTLALYISITNLGTINEFFGPFRNIKLNYSVDGKRNSIENYDNRVVMRDENEETNLVIYELLYKIPRIANKIEVIIPDPSSHSTPPTEISIYENSFNHYEKSGGKDIIYGSKSKNESLYPEFLKYFIPSLGIGANYYGYNKQIKTPVAVVLDVSLYPKFFTINDKFHFGGSFNMAFSFLQGSQDNIMNIFGTNNGTYTPVVKQGDTSFAGQTFIGAGLGFGVKFGKIKPAVILNYGNLNIAGYEIKIRDKVTGNFIPDPNIKGPAWKLDFILGISDVSFKYSFGYFNYSNNNSPYKGIYRNHYLTLNFGGFIIW